MAPVSIFPCKFSKCAPFAEYQPLAKKVTSGIRSKRLLDDLSQITFVLDDMSQKGAICSKIIWTICHNFV